MTDDMLCPVPHRKDPERPLKAATGARICEGHLRGLHDNLGELPRLHHALAEHLTRGGGSEPGGSLAVGIALDDAVVAARDHIKATLVSWACIALEEGPWTVPPPDNPDAIARWLRVRINWLANQEWTAELVTNVAETTSEARRQVQPDKPYLVELGPCPQPTVTFADGDPVIGPCDGTVIASMRRADSLLPSVLYCTTRGEDEEDPHQWGPAQWHTLGRRMGKALNPDAAATFMRAFGSG